MRGMWVIMGVLFSTIAGGCGEDSVGPETKGKDLFGEFNENHLISGQVGTTWVYKSLYSENIQTHFPIEGSYGMTSFAPAIGFKVESVDTMLYHWHDSIDYLRPEGEAVAYKISSSAPLGWGGYVIPTDTALFLAEKDPESNITLFITGHIPTTLAPGDSVGIPSPPIDPHQAIYTGTAQISTPGYSGVTYRFEIHEETSGKREVYYFAKGIGLVRYVFSYDAVPDPSSPYEGDTIDLISFSKP